VATIFPEHGGVLSGSSCQKNLQTAPVPQNVARICHDGGDWSATTAATGLPQKCGNQPVDGADFVLQEFSTFNDI